MPAPLLLSQVLLADITPGHRWGLALVALAAGEALRLASVRWIGPRSRTRGADVGPLVTAGPYARTRNPLYVANGLIWLGAGLLGGPGWALAWALSWVLVYPHVVAREEANVARQHQEAFSTWAARVPRWLPVGRGEGSGAPPWSWRAAARSERPTLLSIGGLLLVSLLRPWLGLPLG